MSLKLKKKNIISVNQFARDNCVSIDFHPTCFYIKDLATWSILLTSPTKNGLYPHQLLLKLFLVSDLPLSMA